MNSIYSNYRNKTTHFTVRDLFTIEQSIRTFKKDKTYNTHENRYIVLSCLKRRLLIN